MRKYWLVLAQAATWIGTLIASFFLPPPIGAAEGRTDVVYNFAKFILTSFVGLMIIPVLLRRRKKDVRMWLGGALFLMIGSILSFFLYMYYKDKWTCLYGTTRVVIGSEYTPDVLEAEGGQTAKDCFETSCGASPGGPELVYTAASIERHRIILSFIYVMCVPLFASCLIAVTQSVFCATRGR